MRLHVSFLSFLSFIKKIKNRDHKVIKAEQKNVKVVHEVHMSSIYKNLMVMWALVRWSDVLWCLI
jgi:hypothetical protein